MIRRFLILACFILTNQCECAPSGMDGCFLTFDQGENWGPERWDDEISTIYSRGLRQIVLAYSVSEKGSFYPSDSIPNFQDKLSPISAILSSCETINKNAVDDDKIFVFLGLIRRDAWEDNFLSADDYDQYLESLCSENRDVFDEINTLYGDKSPVKGYFIGHEIGNYHWNSDRVRVSLSRNFLNPLCSYIHEKEPNKLIAISPYFNPVETKSFLDPYRFGVWWYDTMTQVPDLDVLILQDGIATRKGLTNHKSVEYSASLKFACDSLGRKLWSDIEAFDEFGKDIPPTDLNRIPSQVFEQQDFAESLIFWQWWTLVPTDSTLNLDTWSVLEFKTKYGINPINLVLGKEYSLSVPPHKDYPEHKGLLTNNMLGSTQKISEHVGWFNSKSIEVVVDLQSHDRIYGIDVAFLRSDVSWADVPISIEVSVSGKPANFDEPWTLTHTVKGDERENLFEIKFDRAEYGRYVNLRILPSPRWFLMSEIRVIGAPWNVY